MKEIDYNIESIKAGVNKLADAVLLTMGPNGSTVVITDDFGRPYATKDGVSVANEIVLDNPSENAIASLIRQAAQQTVKEAGDGTTTSICLAQAIIQEGFKQLEKGKSISDIKKELDLLESYVLKKLDKDSKKLNREDLKYVARISANNDVEIGDIIASAYKHSDNVKVQETKNTETSTEYITGVKLDTPYFDSAFINNPSRQSIEYSERMSVILIDGHLNDLDYIAKLLEKMPSVVIVADHFSKQAVSILKDNYNRNKLDIALIKSPSMAGQRRNIMKDLSAYFNIKLVDPTKKITIKDDPSEYIGYTDTLFSDKNKTIFYNRDANIKDYLKDLKEAFENEEDETSKNLIEKRLNYLSGAMSIIKVGGNSEVEIKEKKDRIDDAVLAVKCALEEGVIEGGGAGLIRATLGQINIFSHCLNKPYRIIFPEDNINLGEKEIVVHDLVRDYYKEKIIDPVKVTKTALKNAISVSKIILSTKAIVLNPRLWS